MAGDVEVQREKQDVVSARMIQHGLVVSDEMEWSLERGRVRSEVL